MGQIVGSLIGIWLLAQFWEWAVLKRVVKDPPIAKVGGVIVSLVTAMSIYTLTSRDMSGYSSGMFSYLISAIVWSIIGYRRGIKLRV
mgnify:CR=1 FL=1